MSTVKVTFDMPEIEGYEYTGEYRPPKSDEYFLNQKLGVHDKVVFSHNYDDFGRRAILKKKRWRAKESQFYYAASSNFIPAYIPDHRGSGSDLDYECGNYFKTKEECQEFCDKVKALLDA